MYTGTGSHKKFATYFYGNLNFVTAAVGAKDKSFEQKYSYQRVYHPNKSDIYVVLANMNE